MLVSDLFAILCYLFDTWVCGGRELAKNEQMERDFN